eukprot:scaffold7470_cov84-Skeletonema_dohrnii-CCMP3373.AAC.6
MQYPSVICSPIISNGQRFYTEYINYDTLFRHLWLVLFSMFQCNIGRNTHHGGLEAIQGCGASSVIAGSYLVYKLKAKDVPSQEAQRSSVPGNKHLSEYDGAFSESHLQAQIGVAC